MERLLRYPWPGNVRELQNVIDRAAILSSGTHVTVAPDVLAGLRPLEQEPDDHTLEAVERAHVVRTLQSTGWVVEGPLGAATILGLHPNTLRSRMKKLGIARPPEGADPRHDLS
jgi:transcriptional regulator of acetoin/glycerol metabolism